MPETYRIQTFLIAVLALSFVGCINPYSKFYVAQSGELGTTRSASDAVSPKLIRGNNGDADFQQMLEEGYSFIGYSSFNAANVSADDALEQATAIHADVVIYYTKYTHTLSGAVPITTPTTQTTNTNVYGNAYGSGGYASFNGAAHSTTYGSQTTYVPYNINRFDYFASYWIKSKPGVLGLHLVEMTDDQRKEVGGNKGIAIRAVVQGSPAYRADFLKGDILEKVGDIDIYEVKDCMAAVAKYQGQTVSIDFIRDGKKITKLVQLGVRS